MTWKGFIKMLFVPPGKTPQELEADKVNDAATILIRSSVGRLNRVSVDNLLADVLRGRDDEA